MPTKKRGLTHIHYSHKVFITFLEVAVGSYTWPGSPMYKTKLASVIIFRKTELIDQVMNGLGDISAAATKHHKNACSHI
jgi:hypothetical protein